MEVAEVEHPWRPVSEEFVLSCPSGVVIAARVGTDKITVATRMTYREVNVRIVRIPAGSVECEMPPVKVAGLSESGG